MRRAESPALFNFASDTEQCSFSGRGLGALIGKIYPATYYLTISSGTFSKGLGFTELSSSFFSLLLIIPVLTLASVLLLKKQGK